MYFDPIWDSKSSVLVAHELAVIFLLVHMIYFDIKYCLKYQGLGPSSIFALFQHA